MTLLLFRIIVEPSPIRSLAADCPLKKSRGFNLALIQIIFSVFTTITLAHFSSLRCGLFVFRVFQQLDRFSIYLSIYSHKYNFMVKDNIPRTSLDKLCSIISNSMKLRSSYENLLSQLPNKR